MSAFFETNLHQYRTSKQTYYVHKRKQCACGRTIRELDLRRYGGRAKCWERK